MPMGGKNWMPIDWKRASMSAIFTDPKRALLGRFSVTEPWCDGGGEMQGSIEALIHAGTDRQTDTDRHRGTNKKHKREAQTRGTNERHKQETHTTHTTHHTCTHTHTHTRTHARTHARTRTPALQRQR